ncbi:hypothetical protein [Streptomyces sp. NPDC001889]
MSKARSSKHIKRVRARMDGTGQRYRAAHRAVLAANSRATGTLRSAPVQAIGLISSGVPSDPRAIALELAAVWALGGLRVVIVDEASPLNIFAPPRLTRSRQSEERPPAEWERVALPGTGLLATMTVRDDFSRDRAGQALSEAVEQLRRQFDHIIVIREHWGLDAFLVDACAAIVSRTRFPCTPAGGLWRTGSGSSGNTPTHPPSQPLCSTSATG